jgi:hypothetical protein
MPTLAAGQIVMLLGAAGVGCAAGWLLLKARSAGRRLRFDGEDPTGLGGLSLQTQLLIALVGLLAAYHLAVWAFPASLTSVQFTRNRWWLWLALGLVVCVLSVLMDRHDRTGSDPPA